MTCIYSSTIHIIHDSANVHPQTWADVSCFFFRKTPGGEADLDPPQEPDMMEKSSRIGDIYIYIHTHIYIYYIYIIFIYIYYIYIYYIYIYLGKFNHHLTVLPHWNHRLIREIIPKWP